MTRKFTIGRDKTCDVPIADDSVSRVHAELWLADDGSLIMADSGSSNGTVVIRDGLSFPLRQDVMLLTDQIRFGTVVLGVNEIVDAVQVRHPGVLTPGGGRIPPPPPPPPMYPLPPPPAGAAPLLPARPGQMMRCSCGAVKAVGQPCPECFL
jgi:hypothetical protein